MKRLSLISLLWLVAVVAAFFGGRASMERRAIETEQRRRDLERSTIKHLGKLSSDEFAENLNQKLRGVEFPTTFEGLESIVEIQHLVAVHLPTNDEPYAIYALSTNYAIRVDVEMNDPYHEALLYYRLVRGKTEFIKSVAVISYNRGYAAAALEIIAQRHQNLGR